jgi:hypothetical protein
MRYTSPCVGCCASCRVNATTPQFTFFFFLPLCVELRGRNALKNSLNHSECPPAGPGR